MAKAPRASKPPARYVEVDMGYDLNECWTRARVVRSEQCAQLFSDATRESLLVEVLGGARLWVVSWRDVPPTKTFLSA